MDSFNCIWEIDMPRLMEEERKAMVNTGSFWTLGNINTLFQLLGLKRFLESSDLSNFTHAVAVLEPGDDFIRVFGLRRSGILTLMGSSRSFGREVIINRLKYIEERPEPLVRRLQWQDMVQTSPYQVFWQKIQNT